MDHMKARLRVGAALLSFWSILNVYFVLVVAAAPAGAAPRELSPLCKSGTYRKAHPLICDTGLGGPGAFPGSGGGGGGGGGGLLGAIRDVVGSIL
jgi:hypothetical protein